MERTETRNTDELLRLYSIDEKDIANVRKVGENIVVNRFVRYEVGAGE